MTIFVHTLTHEGKNLLMSKSCKGCNVEAWKIMQPVCRELSDLVNGGYIQLISGSYNESEGSYKINLKSSQIHLASRGFKDSIGALNIIKGK